MSRKAQKRSADIATMATMAAKGAEIKANLLKAIDSFKAYQNENMMDTRLRQTSWSMPGVYERENTRYTREKAIAKARQFVDEQPIVNGLVTGLCDSIVGEGYRLSMQTGDRGWDSEIEDWHIARRDKLDIRGIRTWGQMQRAWYTRRYVDGDVGIYKFMDGKDRQISTIEAERIRWRKFDYLDSGYGISKAKTGITAQQGIALDKNGRMVGAFVGPRPENQMDWAKILEEGKWIDADKFILYMHILGDRIDAIRGTSALMVNFNLFQDIAEILKNVIQKVKNEAFIGLVFTLEQSMTGGIMSPDDTIKNDGSGKKRPHVKMVPGMNLNLQPGEKADLLGMKSPGADLMPFIRFMMRIAGTPYGFPLEMLLLDVSETNFSGGRLLLELAKRRQRVEQDGLAKVSSDIFTWDLQGAIDAKEVKPPKSLKNPLKHRWGMPSLPYYDPGREALANGMNLDRLLVAPQDIIAQNGEQDMDDVLDKWEVWVDACKARNLPVIFGQASTRISDEDNPAGEVEKKKTDTKGKQ